MASRLTPNPKPCEPSAGNSPNWQQAYGTQPLRGPGQTWEAAPDRASRTGCIMHKAYGISFKMNNIRPQELTKKSLIDWLDGHSAYTYNTDTIGETMRSSMRLPSAWQNNCPCLLMSRRSP